MVLTGNNLLESKPESISQLAREYSGATRIKEHGTASADTDTLYTVPAGKKLWLISIILDVNFDAATTGNKATLKIGAVPNIYMAIYGSVTAGSKMAAWNSKEILEVKAGEAITVGTIAAEIRVTGNIIGYLLPAGD